MTDNLYHIITPPCLLLKEDTLTNVFGRKVLAGHPHPESDTPGYIVLFDSVVSQENIDAALESGFKIETAHPALLYGD